MLKVDPSSVEYLLGTYTFDKGQWTLSELELSRMRKIWFMQILSVDFATFSPFSFNQISESFYYQFYLIVELEYLASDCQRVLI